MKKVITILGLFGLMIVQAQVGINQDAPKATLDIKAEKTDGSQVEGLLVPRISKEAAFNMATAPTQLQESNMVYVNDLSATFTPPTGDTTVTDITEKGYYFWNGDNKWVKVAGKGGAEWVYEGDSIRLNRSGVGAFKNKVYYDTDRGLYRNYDRDSYEMYNSETQSFESMNIYEIKVVNLNVRESKGIDTTQTIHKGITYSDKLMNSSLLLINDGNSTGVRQRVTNNSFGAIVENGTSTDYESIVGVSGNVTGYGAGNTRYQVGGSFSSYMNSGTSEGYLLGVRSGVQSTSPKNVSMTSGYASYVGVGGGSRDNVYSFYGHTAYVRPNAVVENSYNISINQNIYDNMTTTITNAAGLHYKGFYGNKGNSKIINNYGILLEDMVFGDNNYAIYTGKGKVRLGDDVSIGTTTAPKKLEVSGAIKVGSDSTAPGIPSHAAPEGTIIYHNQSFYGRTSNGWKKLHN